MQKPRELRRAFHNLSAFLCFFSLRKARCKISILQRALSLSEYIRQRCLSYAPRELPSEDLYWLCEYLRDCQANGTEQDAEFIHGMLQQIRELLILPGRDA